MFWKMFNREQFEDPKNVDKGVNPKIGVVNPPKWMVKIMVPNPMNKWDDLGG